MTDFKKLAGESIASLTPYLPGKPVKELEREMGITDIIKLASNENPVGASPKAIAAVEAYLAEANRYPLGDCYYLRTKIAAKLNVEENTLIFGSGSNEIIELLFRTFLKPGDTVMSYAPSFSVYGIIAQAMGSSCQWVPTRPDFSVDFDALEKAITPNTRIIFLANPNNPTGGYICRPVLEKFLNVVPSDTIVVMDEAYIEYADTPDFPDSLTLLPQYPNLISMRTFSKAYGLAAFRVGYAIAHPDCIDMLNRVRQPFNVNMPAQIAAEAALDDTEFLQKSIETNSVGKKFLYSVFEEMGLAYVPTQTNFILVNVGGGEAVFKALLAEGVIVRYLGPGLKDYIRVTIGTQEENDIFVAKLKKVLGK